MEWTCDRGYELVGSGGACYVGLADVENIDCLFNPILDGKIRALNVNDGDDDDDNYQVFSFLDFLHHLCNSI